MILKFNVLGLLFLWLFTSFSCVKSLKKESQISYSLPSDTVFFAVIGDFGYAGEPAQKVAEMVKSWQPEFIITTGDNSYTDQTGMGFDQNVGEYYCDFIYNPDASEKDICTSRASREKLNRFFPVTGNHEYQNGMVNNYKDYFSLPGDELNYDFTWGPVHFFAINSGPDGRIYNDNSDNAVWLKEQLNQSKSPWKIVYFHHPPYSPGHHGNHNRMQWPFNEWGATMVISGHNHLYARINKKEQKLYYVVNGLGGHPARYSCESNKLDKNIFDVFCYNENYGAMKISANNNVLRMGFYSVHNEELIDTLTISK